MDLKKMLDAAKWPLVAMIVVMLISIVLSTVLNLLAVGDMLSGLRDTSGTVKAASGSIFQVAAYAVGFIVLFVDFGLLAWAGVRATRKYNADIKEAAMTAALASVIVLLVEGIAQLVLYVAAGALVGVAGTALLPKADAGLGSVAGLGAMIAGLGVGIGLVCTCVKIPIVALVGAGCGAAGSVFSTSWAASHTEKK
ncbi:MAG: hypothetical protein V1728_02435 [Candidatus Micrarchaeota archaeon]